MAFKDDSNNCTGTRAVVGVIYPNDFFDELLNLMDFSDSGSGEAWHEGDTAVLYLMDETMHIIVANGDNQTVRVILYSANVILIPYIVTRSML